MNEVIQILQQVINSVGVELIVTQEIAIYSLSGLGGFLALLLGLGLSTTGNKSKTLENEELVVQDTQELLQKTYPPKDEVEDEVAPIVEAEVEPEVVPEVKAEVKVSWSDRLKKGLSRSRTEVWGKLGNIFSGTLDEEALEEVEEILYGADIGPQTTSELIEALEEKVKKEKLSPEAFTAFIKEFLKEKMEPVQNSRDEALFQFSGEKSKMPKVIMIVGVNGAGKTTTIGKLATKLTNQGAKVVVGACDTFRAAAVDQLQVWCERAGASMIRAKEGANPSGVGYDALQAAMKEEADYCILDTAGRLHTAGNLMEELKKSKEVLKKLMPDAPHHVLLVIDAITGQNAIRQAEEFNKTLDLTGLIFTKCDGSSKAGSAVAIVQKLNVPIAYIGVGENVEDLDVFDLGQYLDALVDA